MGEEARSHPGRLGAAPLLARLEAAMGAAPQVDPATSPAGRAAVGERSQHRRLNLRRLHGLTACRRAGVRSGDGRSGAASPGRVPDGDRARADRFATADRRLGPGPDATGAGVRRARTPRSRPHPRWALATLAASGVEPASIVDALVQAGAAGALLVGRADAAAEAALQERAAEAAVPLWRIRRRRRHDHRARDHRRPRQRAGRHGAACRGPRGGARRAGPGRRRPDRPGGGRGRRARACRGHRGTARAGRRGPRPSGSAGRRGRRSVPGQPPPGAACARRCPARASTRLAGRWCILGEPPATEFERLAVDRIVALVALELARDLAGRREAGAGAAFGCPARATARHGSP